MSGSMLTKDQAAKSLQVSTRTLNRYVATGKLKVFKLGNVFRVDPAELERFKRRHTV